MAAGYKHGNFSDIVKHANLELLVDALNPASYIELHSGEGKYGKYEGSALRALGIMHKKRNDYFAYLHEIRDDARQELIKNVHDYPDVRVRKDWRESIEWCLSTADSSTLFMIDPTYTSDYDDILFDLPAMLKKQSGIFMYVPEAIGQQTHAQIVALIKNFMKKAKRKGIDITHPAGKGCYKRTDHNIIAADVNKGLFANPKTAIRRI